MAGYDDNYVLDADGKRVLIGLTLVETIEFVARQSGWEHSDNQDGHFGGRGGMMIVAARR